MRQHCAITSRFSANHSDSASHVTSRHDVVVDSHIQRIVLATEETTVTHFLVYSITVGFSPILYC